MTVCGILLHFAWDMGVKKEDLTLLAMAGLLHDVGKALVPQRILDKSTALSADELEEMKKHPAFSRDIIEGIPDLDKRIAAIAVHHHERLDGTGYPDRLEGGAIDDLTRLVSIVDVYAALIDERAYREALTPGQAFAAMERTEGHLDPDILARLKQFALQNQP
jgi:HD-GYP domain-containing protein (c-di-GMP phosphodiesterase class II)